MSYLIRELNRDLNRDLNRACSLRSVILLVCLGVIAIGCSRASNKTVVESGLRSPTEPPAREPAIDSSFTMDQEAYDSFEENEFFSTLDQPQSTFAIDVDTASYANVRRLIRDGILPPKGAVRLEEMVNYFPYDYQEPAGPHPFSVATEMAECPWNDKNRLLRVALRGRSDSDQARKACNLVFLIDVSGSMGSNEKLPLVQSALRLLVKELDDRDRIAIVVYAGASGLALPSTAVRESSKILAALENLSAGGSTNGGSGISLAYKAAEENRIDGGVNRVILCTDGDFNVGISSQSDLVDLVQTQAKQKVFLSVLGFGKGNLQDATMEKLADKGNGNYAYIDSLLEARKVLVEQRSGTLVTIASDVKIQIDFNPKHVAKYRLLGYENRILDNQDFRDDQKDAGEMGAGHTVTAFYELVPQNERGSADASNELIRTSEFVDRKPSKGSETDTMLTVNLRYKRPEVDTANEFQVRVQFDGIGQTPTTDFAFASSVLAYGMLLRNSKFAGHANWDWVIANAEKNVGKDPLGLRSEFVQLAKSARRIVPNAR